MTINIPQIFTETAKDFCIKDPKLEIQPVSQQVLAIKLMCAAHQPGFYNYTFENIHFAGKLEDNIVGLRQVARTMAIRLSTYSDFI